MSCAVRTYACYKTQLLPTSWRQRDTRTASPREGQPQTELVRDGNHQGMRAAALSRRVPGSPGPSAVGGDRLGHLPGLSRGTGGVARLRRFHPPLPPFPSGGARPPLRYPCSAPGLRRQGQALLPGVRLGALGKGPPCTGRPGWRHGGPVASSFTGATGQAALTGTLATAPGHERSPVKSNRC